jgi:hypothetical protein
LPAPLPSQGAAFCGWIRRTSASCCCKRFEIVWGTANPEGAKRSRGPAARRARKKAPKQCPIPEAETIKASEESRSVVCGTETTDSEERFANGESIPRFAQEDRIDEWTVRPACVKWSNTRVRPNHQGHFWV